jgi:hypothetical protein
MIVKLLEHTLEYDNKPSSIEEIFAKINEQLNDSDHHFSHLIIDNEEVYENHDAYIFENVEQINQIEVKVKSIKEFVNELLLSIEEYLHRALPEVEILVDEFYQGPKPESWEKFNQLLQGIQWLDQVIITIDQSKFTPKNWDDYLKISASLKAELQNMEEAVENKDMILIADIIQYEIIELLKSYEESVKTTIDQEGYHHDIN